VETADLASDAAALPLALGALLAPWALLSLLLPLVWMSVAFLLIATLAGLLHLGAAWSRQRAEQLGLAPDGWALAAVLSLGFSMLMLLGPQTTSGYDALCDDCGRLSDARSMFCTGCGSYY
jgi:hypothetical protein